MVNSPKVSIVILNWNGLEDTIECLESLKKITYSNYNVIVVDNASSGNDVEVLREKFGDYIHIIQCDKNYGFAEGNNVGIRNALSRQSDYVFLLNNDTVVDTAFLSELVDVAEEDKKTGILGGKIYYYSSNRLQSIGGSINWWLGRIREYGTTKDVGQYEWVAKRDFVWATAILIKRGVIESIGFLDPNLFFGLEDYDFCTRAIRAGFKVLYIPKSKVWHKDAASRKKLPDFPETKRLIQQQKGALQYKCLYRLFHKYSPRPLFLFAYLNCMRATIITFYFSLVIRALRYFSHGYQESAKR